MSNIWITSDTHYGHQNMVRGETSWQDSERARDFDTLRAHDDVIVNSINRVVKRDDFLYHLGDWSMGGKDKIYEFRKRIICNTVYLIQGNHDVHIRKQSIVKTDKGFMNCNHLFYSVGDILNKKWAQRRFVMCHFPILSWEGKARDSIHLYGHTHEELNYHTNAVCVCMDVHPEFRPYSLTEILKIVDDRKKEYISVGIEPAS